MSKIICDVCGTSYPETATQCPICGCVRPGEPITIAGNTHEADGHAASTYTYVKGGRFSKTNVKKRSQGKPVAETERPRASEEKEPQKGKNETGLVIAILALLLAIVGVVIFIALRFFVPSLNAGGQAGQPAETTGNAATEDSTFVTELEIPCQELRVSRNIVEFDRAGVSLLLNITVSPKDTTDEILFSSRDEKVATVTAEGKITSVGGGETVIEITCGDQQIECQVFCNFESTDAETTEPTTVTYPTDDFKLNRDDFTLNSKGDTWKLYKGKIPADQITWTSENEKVATVKDGVVTAVGKGLTKVHGEYGGIKVSCVVRCADSVGKPDETPAVGKYIISHTDVTIAVGEKFTLSLKDAEGKTISVTWSAANNAICTISGNAITGAKSGNTQVSTNYEGETYTCRVIVK